MKSSLPLIKINQNNPQIRINRLESTQQDKKNHINRYLHVATESEALARASSKQVSSLINSGSMPFDSLIEFLVEVRQGVRILKEQCLHRKDMAYQKNWRFVELRQ